MKYVLANYFVSYFAGYLAGEYFGGCCSSMYLAYILHIHVLLDGAPCCAGTEMDSPRDTMLVHMVCYVGTVFDTVLYTLLPLDTMNMSETR